MAAPGGEIPIETSPNDKFCIESEVPLTESIMWDMLKNYYTEKAIEAWSTNVVPSFVTSNSRLAKVYAKVIMGYLIDWFNGQKERKNAGKSEDPTGAKPPIYILEIGAGHGRFTFLVLKALLKTQDLWEKLGLPKKPFVYIFSDVAEGNIQYCMKHSKLKVFVDQGMLDFATFDGNNQNFDIKLRISGAEVPRNNPLIAIANYVLDSLLTDSWRITPGKTLERSLISIYSTQQEDDTSKSEIMTRMSVKWSWKAIDSEEDFPFPEVPEIKEILGYYASKQQEMSFLLPIGAFRLFHVLLDFTNNNLLCLVGDKGYPTIDEFYGHREPHLAVHGSISFMVNLHAIMKFFEVRGGYSISTPWRDTFQIIGLWGSGNEKPYGVSKYSFSCDIEDLVPDGLINWQRSAADVVAAGLKFKIKDFLALLRYSGHDAEVFWNFREFLKSQSVFMNSNPRLISDVLKDIRLVHGNYFPIRDDEDVSEVCAHLCMLLGEYKEAIYYFEESLKDSKEDSLYYTYTNMASCYQAIHNFQQAKKLCNKAMQHPGEVAHVQKIMEKLEMSEKPLKLAIIGIEFWARTELTYLILKDSRCVISAIYSVDRKLAYQFVKRHDLNFATIYSGASGIQQILAREDIEACMVGADFPVMEKLLQLCWTAKKHVITRSPPVANLKIFSSLLGHYNKFCGSALTWCCVNTTRDEGMIDAAASLLKEKGECIGYSLVHISEIAFVPAQKSILKELYVIELTEYLAIIRELLKKSVTCICSRLVAGTPSPNSQDCETANSSSARQKPALSLTGWARLTSLHDTKEGVSGSFYLTCGASENMLQLRVFCELGEVEVTRKGAVWHVNSIRGDSSSQEGTAFPCMGSQIAHERWMDDMYMISSKYCPIKYSISNTISKDTSLSPAWATERMEEPKTKITEIDQEERSTPSNSFQKTRAERPVANSMENPAAFIMDCAIAESINFSIENDGDKIGLNYKR